MKTIIAFVITLLLSTPISSAFWIGGNFNTEDPEYFFSITIKDKETDEILLKDETLLLKEIKAMEFGEDDTVFFREIQFTKGNEEVESKTTVAISIENESDNREIELSLYERKHYETEQYRVTICLQSASVSLPLIIE